MLLLSSPSVGERAELPVRWSVPPACPSEAEFVEHLHAIVGRTLARTTNVPWSIAVTVARQGAGPWQAQVELLHDDARELQGVTAPTCAEVLDVAVVVAATFVLATFDGEAPGMETIPKPAEERDVAPSPTTRPVSAQPRNDRARPTRGSRDRGRAPRPWAAPLRAEWWAHGGPVLGWGPGWSGFVGGGIGLGARTVRVELGGHYRFATDTPASEGVYARSRLAFATATLLWAPVRRRTAFRLGAGATVGAALAEGRGNLDPALRDSVVWAGGLVQGGFVHWFDRRFGMRVMLLGTAGTRPLFLVATPRGDKHFRAAPQFAGALAVGIHFSLR